MNYYHVEITIIDVESGSKRKEIIPFKSLWAAEYMAEKYIKCVDVSNIDIVDQSTGEVMWSAAN